ncbi:helix-turn-helix domain-containing protein [Flavobacterium nitrogenifigens]|uniref:helix-turn-helix domain-containing protein n=1 Tax=Flavobacterium nitrogenifigens TaxID=1617283 RepID=UPI0035930C65
MDLQIILEVVTKETNTTQDALKSACRKREISDARFLFFFFSFYLTSKSCIEIGRFLCRKHHTALYGAKKAAELKKNYKDFYKKFHDINNKLNLNT